MDDHIQALPFDIEKKSRLDELKRFIHEGRTVDGVLDAHAPVRVGGRLLGARHAHLIQRRREERPAGCRDCQLFQRATIAKTLKNG